MSFDVTVLEPYIEQILSAPGTDLNTISAKRVRKQLVEFDPALTPETLKEHRESVDQIISSVFEKVSHAAGGVSVHSAESSKRKREDEDGGVGSVEEDIGEEGEATPDPPKKRGKKSTEEADAELARKLSSEINGRSRRSGGSSAPATKAKKTASRKSKKSAATVESGSDDDDDGHGKKKAKPKKKASGGAKGGFAKEYILSEPLSAVLQVDKLSRPQVVKQLWEYIRGNDLQNPSNKREIMCDEGLRAVFNVDKIDMFKMNKVLGQHLHENEG